MPINTNRLNKGITMFYVEQQSLWQEGFEQQKALFNFLFARLTAEQGVFRSNKVHYHVPVRFNRGQGTFEWTAPHTLTILPEVTIVDSAGNELMKISLDTNYTLAKADSFTCHVDVQDDREGVLGHVFQ